MNVAMRKKIFQKKKNCSDRVKAQILHFKVYDLHFKV